MKNIKKSFVLGLLSALIIPFGVVSAQEGNLPPEQVRNLKATPDTEKVVLKWDVGIDDDGYLIGYKIYFGTKSVQNGEDEYYESEVFSESTKTTYTVEDLDPLSEYYFAVTAVDDEQVESPNYSDEVKAAPLVPKKEFAVLSARQTEPNQIVIQMSDEVMLESELDAFVIENMDTGDEIFIADLSVSGDEVTITIDDELFRSGDEYKVIASSSVVNKYGDPVSSGVTDEVTFTSRSEAQIEEDSRPAEEPVAQQPTQNDNTSQPDKASAPDQPGAKHDIGNLVVDITPLKAEGTVMVSWSQIGIPSIADQIIYVKKNNGPWDNGYSFGPSTNTITLEVEKNTKYEIKVVAVDTNGTESAGQNAAFDTTLTKSGGSNLLVLIITVLAGGVFILTRRSS